MTRGPTAAELLRVGARDLESAGRADVDTPRLDAEVLLRRVLDQSREALLVRLDQTVSCAAAAQYRALLVRRSRGEPVAYLTGRKEFYGLSLRVGPEVLVPRPETEILVEAAIGRVPYGSIVVDVGTGSGAIAVALAANRQDVRVVATDRSARALAVARSNARGHGLDARVGFIECDLAAALGSHVAVVLANLPYIPTGDLGGLPPTVVDFEPRLALDGGRDGLDVYRGLLDQLRLYHRGITLLCFEIGAGQERPMRDEIAHRWPDATVDVLPDLRGIPRVVLAKL